MVKESVEKIISHLEYFQSEHCLSEDNWNSVYSIIYQFNYRENIYSKSDWEMKKLKSFEYQNL